MSEKERGGLYTLDKVDYIDCIVVIYGREGGKGYNTLALGGNGEKDRKLPVQVTQVEDSHLGLTRVNRCLRMRKRN